VAAGKKFEIKELGRPTWPAFVRVMEKHNGVWNGCWCIAYHVQRSQEPATVAERRAFKEQLVKANRSHAALVFDGDDVAGWCQFGPPSELPARMGGVARLGTPAPDWRITCFFVDRDHRRMGVADTALAGALRMIAAAGGGTVDGYPVAIVDKRYSSSFLWSGTESMFTKAGFERLGSVGRTKLVMRKRVRSRS
jgi:ribosomal protein S18 acetylase RimI-like enzyme